MVREWTDLRRAQEAAERVKQEQAAAAAKEKAAEAKEKARIAARLKIGDRVWVRSDSYVARDAGYYLAQKPRLYGTVVDADVQRNVERYAVKWDEWVPSQVTWVDGQGDLNRVTADPRGPTGK